MNEKFQFFYLFNKRTFSQTAIVVWTGPSLLEPSQDARVAKSVTTRRLKKRKQKIGFILPNFPAPSICLLVKL
jgi:hypothetical protein